MKSFMLFSVFFTTVATAQAGSPPAYSVKQLVGKYSAMCGTDVGTLEIKGDQSQIAFITSQPRKQFTFKRASVEQALARATYRILPSRQPPQKTIYQAMIEVSDVGQNGSRTSTAFELYYVESVGSSTPGQFELGNLAIETSKRFSIGSRVDCRNIVKPTIL